MSLPFLHSPAHIVQQMMVDMGSLGTDPTAGSDWPIYIASEPDTPDNVITVYNTQGTIDGRSMIDGEVYEHYGFQVRIRTTPGDEAIVRAGAIAQALAENVVNRTVNLDGYTYLVCSCNRRGGIMDIGKETPTSERNVFTINYTAAIYRTL